MDEIVWIKDELILLAIHPEKHWMRSRQNMGYALLAATLCDMALIGKIQLVQGVIHSTPTKCGDPIIDDLALRAVNMNGRKLRWLIRGRSFSDSAVYRKQMRLMETRHMITSEPIKWLGITLGRRYRVNYLFNPKAIITNLERVLIYSREPDVRTRVLIALLNALELTGVFFPRGESRKRAKSRAKILSRQTFGKDDDTFRAIFRESATVLELAGSKHRAPFG